MANQVDIIGSAIKAKQVDMIGAEDMLTSMTNAPGATAAVVNKLTQTSAAIVDEKLMALQAPMIGQTLPPPGAETGFHALMDLPNDIAEWFSDFLDGFNLAAPIMSFLAVFSGGVMPWLTAAFLGLKIFQIGRTFWEPGQRVRGPVNLTYYKVPTPTTQPVVAYLNNAHGIEVRGTQDDGQGNTMIGVPIYHRGKADRAFDQLQRSTELQYTRL